MTKQLITIDELDLASLSLWLQDNMLPDGGTFLASGSVGATAMADTPWQNLPMVTGWSNYGGGFPGPEYQVDLLGFVHLRGVVAYPLGWVHGVAVATLPLGARPVQGSEMFNQRMY